MTNKEITWLRVNRKKLFQIKRDLLRESYALSVSLPLGLEFVVETNQKDQLSHLKKLFKTDRTKSCEKSVAQIAGFKKEDISKYGIDTTEIRSPYVGFIDETSNYGLLLGQDEGLLKSLIVGFASNLAREKGYYPSHASVCQIDDVGIMLTGGHMAGKTASLFSLLYVARNEAQRKILADDWVLVQEKTGEAIALEDKISFTDKFSKEFGFLGLNKFFQIEPSGKIYVSPNEVYGPGTKIDKCNINAIVLLEPLNRKHPIITVDLDYVASKIVEGAYHMPICNSTEEKIHIDFWKRFLNSRLVLSFDTRSSKGVPESYEILYDYIFRREE